ncbi:hypothetical protein BABINDRAFT_161059 [Babjeviella inositovora NRRL Y-12698]|uniref:Isopentenyl-diphosphate Delta-isomerase n=1 Tax=Babjeviella inositovora NRRL Y-12698 TaxID=984486 RepID=A0A1E3QT20_9ASCO|nr:uncharacterized protein BABINDRAFT_161059 [Babjeviella inositovora NRRL Y-12698]ODQ80863.1 hypothetical protein BABINDRAFT_161059 [Babjeviella inositovora NRRL Y-12698]
MSSYAKLVQSLSPEKILADFPDVTPLAHTSGAPRSSGSSNDAVLAGHDEEQIRLMEELCIACDWEDKPVGAVTKKACHLMENIEKGLLHRAFSVFLFNDEGKLLIQQRADEKITFAGMWTNTCCSHPLAIKSELGYDLVSSVAGAKNAAVRKLEHELGIQATDVPLDCFQYLTRIHYKAPSTGLWGEHEVDYILIAKANAKVEANFNEIKDHKYVTAGELKAMFVDPELVFTPWFKLICESYLFKWWDNLDNLTQFEDNKINRML